MPVLALYSLSCFLEGFFFTEEQSLCFVRAAFSHALSISGILAGIGWGYARSRYLFYRILGLHNYPVPSTSGQIIKGRGQVCRVLFFYEFSNIFFPGSGRILGRTYGLYFFLSGMKLKVSKTFCAEI